MYSSCPANACFCSQSWFLGTRRQDQVGHITALLQFFPLGSFWRKVLLANEKRRFLDPIQLFSQKKLLPKGGKSVASRGFLGRVGGEQAVVPPVNGKSYLG